jgi:hypothetical protein
MPAVVTPYSQTIVTDIDGDGLNEVIVFDDTLLQLAIVHQFHYTDFTLSEINSTVWPNSNSPIWTSDTNPHYWTAWASQQATVPGGWTIKPGDAVVAADLDGDGLTELLIYNLTKGDFGILKWQTTTNQLQTIFKASGVNNLGAAGAQYFVIPNMHAIVPAVPANAAGILYYHPATLAMGMFSYSASQSKFVPWWTHTGSSLFGWNLGASSPPANQFYPGFFQTAGTPTVVVYDPVDAFIAVLQWNGTDFASGGGAGHNVGGWSFGSTDQLQCADLDGDGLTEILIYNPGTAFLGVLEWNNTNKNFQAPVVTNGTITTGSNSWTIGNNDKYYCLNQAPGNPALIVAFSADSLKVALLEYQGGKFVCQWTGSSLAPNKGWPMTAADTFYVGSPTAAPPLFTLSYQGPDNTPTLGAVAASATGLQLLSSVTVPVQAWSPAFVANAPTTPFTPFTSGDQPAIYTYLGSLFPVPGQPGLNQPVRTLYTNADYQGKFQGYADTLAGIGSPSEIPSTWPAHPATWSTSDWTAVVDTIVAECNQVDTVYTLYSELSNLAGALNAFQQNDFQTVTQNIKGITGNLPSDFDYWVGEFVVGSLWVMAACAGFFSDPRAAGAFGVFFTIAGSVAGALYGYDPEEKETFPFDDVQHQITETLAAAFVTQSLDLTAFLEDPVKLNICNGLSSNEWEIPTSLPSAMQEPFQEIDRLWMYQQIVPNCLSIQVEMGGSSNGALYSNNGFAYNFNVPLSKAEFQASAFYKDLFSIPGVSEKDFFNGLGAWAAIPREG